MSNSAINAGISQVASAAISHGIGTGVSNGVSSGVSPVTLLDLHPAPADLRRLVELGLQRQPKQLPAWLLYDEEGSRLFDRICEQPEYCLTRVETALLVERADAIAASLGPGCLVEFGAGKIGRAHV